jgi:hypothetical protein
MPSGLPRMLVAGYALRGTAGESQLTKRKHAIAQNQLQKTRTRSAQPSGLYAPAQPALVDRCEGCRGARCGRGSGRLSLCQKTQTKSGSELPTSGPLFISTALFDLIPAHLLTLLLIGRRHSLYLTPLSSITLLSYSE